MLRILNLMIPFFIFFNSFSQQERSFELGVNYHQIVKSGSHYIHQSNGTSNHAYKSYYFLSNYSSNLVGMNFEIKQDHFGFSFISELEFTESSHLYKNRNSHGYQFTVDEKNETVKARMNFLTTGLESKYWLFKSDSRLNLGFLFGASFHHPISKFKVISIVNDENTASLNYISIINERVSHYELYIGFSAAVRFYNRFGFEISTWYGKNSINHYRSENLQMSNPIKFRFGLKYQLNDYKK